MFSQAYIGKLRWFKNSQSTLPHFLTVFKLFSNIASMGNFCCATLFGWVAPILPELLGPNSEIPMSPQEASWMISSPEIMNLITPIPAGVLADHFGRKPWILCSAPLFTLGWIVILYFKTYTALLVSRSIQGGAVGIVFSVVPVYLGEIASNDSRGAISSLFFMFSWISYLFEYSTGPSLSFNNFTLLTLSTSVVFFSLMLIQPESPYFLLMKDDKEKAYKSLKWFRSSQESTIQEELQQMKTSVENDQDQKATWKEIIATPVDRKALFIVLFTSSLRILSGTMPILAYATSNFQITPNLVIPAQYITITLGLVLVLGACCSFFTLDYLGRRPLIIGSALGSSVCLFIAGMFYYLKAKTSIDVSSVRWLAPFSILLYAAFAVAGLYPVATAYTSELFTSNTRSSAASVSAVISTLFTLITLKLFQNFIDYFGEYSNFFLFSAISLIGAIVSYFCLPETKNKTFEQIRELLRRKCN